MEEIVNSIATITHSKVFLVALSVVFYYGAHWLHSRFKSVFLNPVIVSSLAIVCVLNATGVDFETYHSANEVINFMLGVSVVAIGYLMHKNIKHIKDRKYSILLSTFLGSIVGVLCVVGFGYLFGYDQIITLSLQPKSVTTPIALSLSKGMQAMPELTALAVVVTGVFGSVVGPSLLKFLRIDDSVARGLALGSSAHAVGTARALELGALEGAVGGAAIGLMGLFTSIVLPIINSLL